MLSAEYGTGVRLGWQSAIVNLDMVDSVCNDTIMLKNQTEIPLSNHFKGAFMKALYFNADS